MRQHRFHIYVIGVFVFLLSQTKAHPQEAADEFSGTPGMVYVEPTNIIQTQSDGEYRLVPYLERRGRWGFTASVGYSSFEPTYYEPDFLQVDSSEIYVSPEVPMVELRFSVKRNAGFGSLGGELTIGVYQNDSDIDPLIIESSLQVIPIYLGATLNFDAFSPEPWIVPYMSGGVYTVFYEETADTRSVQGNTALAPYMTAGGAFQLDWLDRESARRGYEDSGIQATYIYAQVSKQFASTAEKDKGFETDMSWGTGIRVEF